MQEEFDVAVIGSGMIGASAARHLSAMGFRVAAVGPSEPANWRQHNGVFASHYDEARITRVVDPDPVWSTLAARSIAAYQEIEEASGITFHHPVGCLRVTPFMGRTDDTLLQSAENGDANGAEFQQLSSTELREQFPYLRFPSQSSAVWETGAAGYINPRALIAAQLQMASTEGATLVQETVTGVEQDGASVRLTTDAGSSFSAERVLLATGAFTNLLLPQPQELHPRLVSVLLAELDDDELQRLKGIPSIIYRLENDPVLYSVYTLPPVRYPDGKTYFKIGGQLHEPIHRYYREQLVNWFHGDGNKDEIEALQEVLAEMLPDLRAVSRQSRPCVVTHTAHDRPFIDQLEEDGPAPARVFVAAGGCGGAAKSSVEIGRLAAKMVVAGAWDDDLPAEWFQTRLMPTFWN